MTPGLLSVPWRPGPSPDSRGVFADLDGERVMTVLAKTHEVAEHVAALHNAGLVRQKAEALAEAVG